MEFFMGISFLFRLTSLPPTKPPDTHARSYRHSQQFGFKYQVNEGVFTGFA